MKIKIKHLIALLVLLISVMPVVKAAPIHWKNNRIHYSVEGKPLKDVLRDFTASQGIAASVAPTVDGMVSGKFDMAPQAFLNTLASSFGFVWYYDGALLSISAASDIKSIVLRLNYASMDELRMTLDRLGLSDTRYPIVFDDVQHTAVVSGPPYYLQLVSNIAQGMDHNASQVLGTQIRIFKLRHAWAADRDVDIGGKVVRVPGVASVLDSLFGKSKGLGSASSSYSSNVRRVSATADIDGAIAGPGPVLPPANGGGNNALLPPLPQNFGGDTALGNIPLGEQLNQLFPGAPTMPGGAGGANLGMDGLTASRNRGGANGLADSMLPVIQADARTNSILIRDVPARMEQYRPVIETLDVKPRLIEIQATIIQIDDGALQQLGIDWRLHSKRADFQFGNGEQQQMAFDSALDPHFGSKPIGPPGSDQKSVNLTPVGGALTTVLGDAGRYLMARINALEQTNQAKIEASPRVTTLDNIEAVMDNRQQMFVQVRGYTAGNLYTISTGVSLRVLPMVVEENNQTQIKLEVNIEDGQFSKTQTVQDIPMVTTSQIKTQAFVTQGQSLLIAGYRKSETTSNNSGVPVLSKIPFLGALFRYQNKNQAHRDQLFLLSPRVIDL